MDKEICKDCSLSKLEEEHKKEIEELKKRIEELERPSRNSSNSSLPPSSDLNKKLYPKREKTGRKPGGQVGHKGHTKMLVETPDEVVEVYPKKCDHCGNDDFEKRPNVFEQRQVVDIPKIKPHIVEYQQKAGICTKCGKRNLGQFPEKITPNVQIGEKLTALIGYLNVHAHMSNQKIAKFSQDILGINVSKSTINNKIMRLSKNLEAEYDFIKEKIRKSSLIGSDETTVRINGKICYLWIFQNALFSLFKTSKRNFDTIQETVGAFFEGSWVSDRFGAQLKVEAYHQLCLAHLIRDLKYIIEAEDSFWAKSLKDLFQKAIEFKNERIEKFNPFEIETFRGIQKFRSELSELFRRPPPKDLEKKLYKGLLGREYQLLHFLDRKEVPPTNNDSERGLRNCVIHRKVIGGFRSHAGARAYDIIASVIETSKKQNQNILQALSDHNSLLLQA